jgi:mannosyl-3-phosphoglycerate phosphatase family protein
MSPLCRPCSALLALDLDGTVLGPGEAFSVEARRGLAELTALGALIVPVTAKSVWEVSWVWDRLLGSPGPLVAVAESGGALYAERGLLSAPDGYLGELGLEYVELGERIEGLERELRSLASTCPGFKRLSRASPEEASLITGLPPARARLAARRLYLEVLWHPDPVCMDRAELEALSMGLYVHRSRRLLHVGGHRGKGAALRRLLREPVAGHCRLVVAMGDSDADEDMLLESHAPIVVPSQSPRRPSRAVNAVPLPEPAPQPRGRPLGILKALAQGSPSY